MGVVRLCWCLGAILVLPSLDARNMKLVPTETKTITTNGATHEISRYILVPDDQTNGPSADSITNEKIQLQIIPTPVKNSGTKYEQSKSDQLYKTSSTKVPDGNINGEVLYETTIKPEDIKTFKTPGLVKYHLVLGAHPDDKNETDNKVDAKILEKLYKINNSNAKSLEHTKVNVKEVPQDSKMNVIYINGNNGAGKENTNMKNEASKSYYQQNGQITHTVTKAVSGLNGAEKPSKAETEPEFNRSAAPSKTGDPNNSGRVKVKINNPTKINNIKYSELPIKWDYTPSASNEEHHPLLRSIGINKTFTLPGKRGRFKIIHEDDDEYEYLDTVIEKPVLEHSTSNPMHQSETHYYKDNYSVHNTKKTTSDDNVNEKNHLTYRLIKIRTNDQAGGTIRTPETTNNDEDAVELSFEKPNTILRPLTENDIEVNKSNSGYSNLEVLRSHTDASIKNEGSHTLTTNSNYAEDKKPNLYYNTLASKSVTKNTNEEPTFDDSVVVNSSMKKTVGVPTLNKSMNISSVESKSENKRRQEYIESSSQVKHTIEHNIPSQKYSLNDGNFGTNINKANGVEPVHEISESSGLKRSKNNSEPTSNENSIQATTILTQKNFNLNELKVLPLKNDTDKKNLSQIEKIINANATNTKTTIATQNAFTETSADDGINIIKINSLNGQSKTAQPKREKIEITNPIVKSNTNATTTAKFGNNNVNNVVTPTVGKTTIKSFVGNELPKMSDIAKFTVLENDYKSTMPKIDSRNIISSFSESHNINENLNKQTRPKLPSFNFNIPVTKTENSVLGVQPKQNHLKVLNYSGNKINFKVDGKEDNEVETVPILDETPTRTIVETELPKLDDARKFSVFQNDNKMIMPEIDSQKIIAVSKNNNTNEDIFDIEIQKAPLFGLNIHVPKIGISRAEPKHNYANVVHDLGTKGRNKTHSKVNTNVKNVVESIVTDNLPNTVPPISMILKVDDVDINKQSSPKIENNYDDKTVHTLGEDNKVIAELNNYSKSKPDGVGDSKDSDFEYNNKKIVEQPQYEHTDLSSNALPVNNIITDQSLRPDKTKLRIYDYINIKPTYKSNLISEPNNIDLKFRLGKPNINVLPIKAEITSTEEMNTNQMHAEQFANVSETKSFDEDNDSQESEGYPYEGDDARSSRITYKEELTHSDVKESEDKTNQYENMPFENVRRNEPNGPPSNQNYYVAGTNYPVYTYSYVPAYTYQVSGCNTQSNAANSNNVLRIREEVKDDQYLQNIVNYLTSSNLMTELKRKYAATGYGVDTNALRMAYIVGHLQNLGIYHELSQEQLQFLIQQVQYHETVEQKNVNHKIEILYDMDDQPAASNQINVPNQYYVMPYASLYNGAAKNELRLLKDDVFLQRYLLQDFDANTMNNAVSDLGNRVLNTVTYLRNQRVPDAMIMQFIVEAKKHLTNDTLQAFAVDCQTSAYRHLGQRIDMIAKQYMQRCTQCPRRYAITYRY